MIFFFSFQIQIDDVDGKYDNLTRSEIAALSMPPEGSGKFKTIRNSPTFTLCQDPLAEQFLPPDGICSVALQRLEEHPGCIVSFPWAKYDAAGLGLCRRLHMWRSVASEITDEMSWLERVTKDNYIDMETKERFRRYIHDEIYNKSIHHVGNLTPLVLRDMCSNRWFSESHLNAVGSVINSKSDHVYVYPISHNLPSTSQSSRRFHVLFLNVEFGLLANSAFSNICDIDSGNHWTIAVVDTLKGTCLHGDSLLGPVPRNLARLLNTMYGKAIGIKQMHNTTQGSHGSLTLSVLPNPLHHRCTKQCFCYPLQNDGSSCGPVVAFVASMLGCHSVLETERFFDHKDNILTPYRIRMANGDKLRCALINLLITKRLPAQLGADGMAQQLPSDSNIPKRNPRKRLSCTSVNTSPSTPLSMHDHTYIPGASSSPLSLNQDKTRQPVPVASSHHDIDIVLQSLPEGYEYSIDSVEMFEKSSFLGAPDLNYHAVVFANVHSKEEAQQWRQKFQNKHKVEFIVARTYKTTGHKIVFRHHYACQHRSRNRFTVPSTCKRQHRTLSAGSRSKSAGCGAFIDLKVMSANSRTKDNAKPCCIVIHFNHSHPISSAHSLSFRKVSSPTKERFRELFKSGHSVSAAKMIHETELQLSSSEPHQLQENLADRSINPRTADVHELHRQWVQEEVGPLRGTAMFEALEKEIADYNLQFGGDGGKAFLQRYVGPIPQHPEHGYQKKPKDLPTEPLLLAICTPIMSRVHSMMPQSSELTFCDSTSSLDTEGCSCFILSSSTPAGAIPVGVLITSGESTSVLVAGFKALKKVLPTGSFYGKGESGPDIFMTDDSATEKASLKQVFPKSKQLLCIFHFLQAMWRWLWNAKNGISDKLERQILMQAVSSILYAETEDAMEDSYEKLVNGPYAEKYPKFLVYLNSLYARREEWALSYRRNIITRGHNTNNYAESGIRILKEHIFLSTKAYNVIQMFTFITRTLELYLQRRLLSVAHLRMDSFISSKFEGLNSLSIKLDNIVAKSESEFEVKSEKKDLVYWVDLKAGVCSCPHGSNGRLCKHQGAVIRHFKPLTGRHLSVPVSASSRKIYAKLALGDNLAKRTDFFVSLNEKILDSSDHSDCENEVVEQVLSVDPPLPSQDAVPDILPLPVSTAQSQRDVLEDLSHVVEDMRFRVKTGEPGFISGLKNLCSKYMTTASRSHVFATTKLSDMLHKFGKTGGYWKARHRPKLSTGTVMSGKRIPVQSSGACRRRAGLPRGRGAVKRGRPPGSKVQKVTDPAQFFGRKGTMKVPHNITANVNEARLNAT